ncbi:hypothetical protein ACHAQJ_010263 [Trichoderma viride]
MTAPFSLTQAILASDPLAYKSATQSPFLTGASQGRVSKTHLGQWLSNDRLYIHEYIRGVGRLLSFLQLDEPDVSTNAKLLHWMIDALVNIRREEEFFVSTAAKYGISLDLPLGPDGRVDKLEGLRRFEDLFDSISPGGGDGAILPWLESAVVFWATEKCYLDAWSGAAAQLSAPPDADSDDDGGALRREFIPNWSSKEFRQFVDQLGEIIDSAVQREMELRQNEGDEIKRELLDRALVKWREVLPAEKAFWPVMKL